MVHELWKDLLKYLTGTLKYLNIRQYVLYGVNDAVPGYCHSIFFVRKSVVLLRYLAVQWRYMVCVIFCYYIYFFLLYVCFMYSFRLF